MQSIFGTAYTYEHTTYTTARSKVTVTCPVHGDFIAWPTSLYKGSGCAKCAAADKCMTYADFSARMQVLHSTLHVAPPTEWIGTKTEVSATCEVHGSFTTKAAYLLGGRGCPACGAEKRASATRMTTEDFIARAIHTHKGAYTYNNTTYVSHHAKVAVTCAVHGDFYTTPASHLHGETGCPVCANTQTKTREAFLQDLFKVHGDLYDATEVVYKNAKTKIKLICTKHGPFDTTPDAVLSQAAGCPHCVHRISKAEVAIKMVLEPHCTVETQARINGMSVDIYLPEHKLAIEFNGELFHADTNPYSATPNPRGKTKHREKEDACTAAGVRLIQLWGSQWENRRTVIERLLLSAIGKDPAPLVGGRECAIDPEVPFREAMEFYEANHPQGKGTSNAKNWGLRHKKTGQLVACMSFSTTADRRGAAATSWAGASLTRYATSHRVPGGASKLLNAWRKANPGMAVMSYSDPMLFAGKTYATLGFTAVKRLDPDYLVYEKRARKLYHKSAFQRKHLEKWRAALKCGDVMTFDPATDVRTEFQMEDAMGIKRVWNTGLIRWELPAV